MRHFVLFSAVLLMAAGLAGCIKVSTRVAVKPDGSGVVIERVLMNTSYIKGMMAGSGSENSFSASSLPERKSLEKSAAAMGEGVSLKSFRSYSENGFAGYEAVYAFRNISSLRVSGRPDEKGSADSLAVSGKKKPADDRISFRFMKGAPSRLVIVMPEDKSLVEPAKKADSPSQPPTPDQQKLSQAIIREVFKGTRMTLAVEVQGSIVSADATCREGAEIILADVDFDRLLEAGNDKAMLDLAGYGSSSGSPLEMINRVPGIKGETKREVSVLFQ